MFPSRCYRRIVRLAFLGVLGLITFGVASANEVEKSPSPEQQKALDTFLRDRDANIGQRYVAAIVDLNDDGRDEAIVYLADPDWCGSGGCTTFVLKWNGHIWQLVTKITVTQPPIRVLQNTSHAWHSLGVGVHGGGLLNGYEAELRFNGKTYPQNPTAPPAVKTTSALAGKSVISEAAVLSKFKN